MRLRPTPASCSARHSSPAVMKTSAPSGPITRPASSKIRAMRNRTAATMASMVVSLSARRRTEQALAAAADLPLHASNAAVGVGSPLHVRTETCQLVDIGTERRRPHVDPPVTPELWAATTKTTPHRTRHGEEGPAAIRSARLISTPSGLDNVLGMGPHLFLRSRRRSTNNNTATATAKRPLPSPGYQRLDALRYRRRELVQAVRFQA
jgi:hypothetical protein